MPYVNGTRYDYTVAGKKRAAAARLKAKNANKPQKKKIK